jgi:hypothetical protein
MVSIAGLGFAQGLADFGENARQAELERKKAKAQELAAESTREAQKAQADYMKQKTEESMMNSQNAFMDLLGDDSNSSNKNPAVPAEEAVTTGLTGGDESYAVQPYDVSTGGTDASLGLGQQEPSYVRGMSLPTKSSSMEPMGVEKQQTPKNIMTTAASTAKGMGVAASELTSEPAKQFMSKEGAFGDIPQSNLDNINSLHGSAMNLVNKIKQAGPAKEYLRQFVGKKLPQRGSPEYPEFFKNLQIAKAAKAAPMQLKAVRDEFEGSILSSTRTAVSQKNFAAASELVSKIGYTNKFQQSKDDPNMVDVMAADGKTVLRSVPVGDVEGMFSNKKELNDFFRDTIKANTQYAQQVLMQKNSQIFQKTSDDQRAKIASFQKLWPIGKYYGVDKKGVFGPAGMTIPITADAYKNPEMARLMKLAGWLNEKGEINDGVLVEYDNKKVSDKSTTILVGPGYRVNPETGEIEKIETP